MTKEEGAGFVDPATRTATPRIEDAERDLEETIKAVRPEDLAGDPPVEGEEEPQDKIPDVVPGDEQTTGTHDWESRYGNLRRFVQKELDGRDSDIVALQGDVKRLGDEAVEATRANVPDMPETDEDLAQLKSEHPSTYNAILRLATGVADGIVAEKMSGLKGDIDTINTRNRKSVEDAAAVSLQRLHPRLDISKLGTDERFVVWLGAQPTLAQNALKKNKEDVETASFVLTAYEREVLDKDPQATTETLVKDAAIAARNVPATTVYESEVQPADKGYDYLESEIDSMPIALYEQNATKIDEAYLAGRVLLDKSGAAVRQATPNGPYSDTE